MYDPSNTVGLYRQGTRVIENVSTLSELNKQPWNSGYLQGILDVPYLNLTPGTRSGFIQDDAYQRLIQELAPLEAELVRIIDDQRRAEEEQTSRDVLRSVQRALKEALLALPQPPRSATSVNLAAKASISPMAIVCDRRAQASRSSV